MAQHKWHKEIKAWADGAEIQIRLPNMTQTSEAFDWMDLGDNDIFRCMNRDYEFRIKPQSKEPQYLYVYEYRDGGMYLYKESQMCWDGKKYVGKIKLEVDDETN